MISPNPESDLDDYARRMNLGSLLARQTIGLCIRAYSSWVERDSILNEPIRTHLRRSQEICDQIAFKMTLPQIQSVEQKENLTYLFNLTKIHDVYQTNMLDVEHEDTKRFIMFCWEEFDKSLYIVNRITHLSTDEIEFEFSTLKGEIIKGSLLKSKDSKYVFNQWVNGEFKVRQTLFSQKENYNIYMYSGKSVIN